MGSSCDCSVVAPALHDPTSMPFKVRAWLYRRASEKSFVISKEALGRCVIWDDEDLENPYDNDRQYGSGKLYTWPDDSHGWDDDECQRYADGQDEEAAEWARIWHIFKRHLVMQRVQRVNQGDPTVRPQWRQSYEVKEEEKEEKKKSTALAYGWRVSTAEEVAT